VNELLTSPTTVSNCLCVLQYLQYLSGKLACGVEPN
jgi:hypothetical protein